MRSWLLVAACATVTGCVPPAGLGPGTTSVPTEAGAFSGGVGLGASSARETFQVEGSGAYKPSRLFLIEAGGAYTLMRFESEQGAEVIAQSGLPYARPTLLLGPAHIGVALSGLGFGGGGGGAAYGLIDVRVGVSQDRWMAYGEWMAHASTLTSERPIDSSSQQWRLGAGTEWMLDDTRLGIAVELAHIDESFRRNEHRLSARHTGGMIKLMVRRVVPR